MPYTGRVYNKAEHRKSLEGILYRIQVGYSWQDIPESFGHWYAMYRRFNLRSKKGLCSNSLILWESYLSASGSSVEAIGKSRGGNTTKIHIAVDSYRLPVKFILTGSEIHDSKLASDLIEQLPDSEYIVADKSYHSDPVREQIRNKGSVPVIPRKSNSKIGNNDIDRYHYKYRYLVDNVSAQLKHYRAICYTLR